MTERAPALVFRRHVLDDHTGDRDRDIPWRLVDGDFSMKLAIVSMKLATVQRAIVNLASVERAIVNLASVQGASGLDSPGRKPEIRCVTLQRVILAVLLSCGCAGESSNNSQPPADASQAPDAATAVPAGCAGLVSTYDLSQATYAGYARRRDPGDETSPMDFGMTATLDEGPPADIFEIQLWSGFGVYKDSVAPGTVPISGDETSLFDCGLCALVFGDLASNGSTDTVLVAQSGTVVVDQISLEVGGSFEGSADTLRYAQVNSDGPIPGGCELQITNIEFAVTLDAP